VHRKDIDAAWRTLCAIVPSRVAPGLFFSMSILNMANRWFPRMVLSLGFGLPVVAVLMAAFLVSQPLWELIVVAVCVLIWTISAATASVIALRYALSKRRAATVMAAFLPCMLAISVITMFSPWRYVLIAGDEVHFLIYRSAYLKEIAQTPLTGEPKLTLFELGGLISTSTIAIVYDASDELALPAVKRSRDWQARAKSHLYCEPEVLPFLRLGRFTEHFYLVAFNC
jgi:hypothetical protein